MLFLNIRCQIQFFTCFRRQLFDKFLFIAFISDSLSECRHALLCCFSFLLVFWFLFFLLSFFAAPFCNQCQQFFVKQLIWLNTAEKYEEKSRRVEVGNTGGSFWCNLRTEGQLLLTDKPLQIVGGEKRSKIIEYRLFPKILTSVDIFKYAFRKLADNSL